MSLDLKGFEIVKGSLAQGNEEPAVSFYNGCITANVNALKCFPESDYIQLLLSKEQKTMVIRAREQGTKDTFRWANKNEKRTPRRIRCIPLVYLIFQMMEWDITCRYKVYAEKEVGEKELLLYFDLTKAEKYIPDQETGQLSNLAVYENLQEIGYAYHSEEDKSKVSVYEDMTVFEIEIKHKKKPVPLTDQAVNDRMDPNKDEQ